MPLPSRGTPPAHALICSLRWVPLAGSNMTVFLTRSIPGRYTACGRPAPLMTSHPAGGRLLMTSHYSAGDGKSSQNIAFNRSGMLKSSDSDVKTIVRPACSRNGAVPGHVYFTVASVHYCFILLLFSPLQKKEENVRLRRPDMTTDG